MKRCFKCLRELPRSEFYVHSAMADGLLGKCKECTRIDVRRNRIAKLNYYRDRERARSKTPAGKATLARSTKRNRERYPEKYRARAIVQNAIRTGALVRKPCEVCGAAGRIHAHHDDYSKPLEVRWLCHEHHCQVEGRWIFQ